MHSLLSLILYEFDIFFFVFRCFDLHHGMKIEHRPRNNSVPDIPILPRNDSTSEFMPVDDKEVEYFFASDASAVIEHTNRVIYLEVKAKNVNLYRILSHFTHSNYFSP